MGEKRITIKEIANIAGVSISAVHSALYDKPGVSEETKKRILKVVRENNYHLNTAAASLKRKPMNVAVAIPALSSVNRYYFNNLWTALNNYKNTLKDYNISFIELPYYIGDSLLESELLRLCSEKELSGIIGFIGFMDSAAKAVLSKFAEKGVTVVLVGEDYESSKRICCVLPDYDMTGRIVGELISNQLHDDGRILICAGTVTIPAHYEVADGVYNYFKENHFPNQIIRKNYSHNTEDHYKSMVDILSKNSDISACFAVTARESTLLGKALEATKRAGSVIAVGSDVFEENMEYLERGVFTNLLNKNPYTQMLVALKCTVDYLVRDIRPVKEKIYVGTEIIFKSSLAMYKQGEPNRLLL